MDIFLEKNNYRFNIRSSAIIKDKSHNKIILSNMRGVKDKEAFILPGGRLEVLENSYDAIFREIKEELGVELEYKLISIEENIVMETKFHMIEFVFYGEIDSFDKINSLTDGWDKFKVVEIDNIDNIDVRPKTMNKLIKQETYNGITHNINYDWA